MKFQWIPEPVKETIKYHTRLFFNKSYVAFFINANIVLYFIYMIEKILKPYV